MISKKKKYYLKNKDIINSKRRKSYRENNCGESRLYRIWIAMKRRCGNKNCDNYEWYGGRGICVSNDWMSFDSFKNDMFKSYLNHASKHGEENTHIERIDNDSNYHKDNCHWATKKEQCRNRRSTVMLTHGGTTRSLAEWCELKNIKISTLWSRLNTYKWTIEKALNTPVNKK